MLTRKLAIRCECHSLTSIALRGLVLDWIAASYFSLFAFTLGVIIGSTLLSLL